MQSRKILKFFRNDSSLYPSPRIDAAARLSYHLSHDKESMVRRSESKELKKRPLGVTRLGERLVFWRDAGGNAVCFYDRCAHRGAALAFGEASGNATVSFSRARVRLDGPLREIPANGKNAPVPERFKMTSYPVHEEYGLIWIWWGTMGTRSAPPAFFDDLKNSGPGLRSSIPGTTTTPA